MTVTTPLTRRQSEVKAHILDGRTNLEIAALMKVNQDTVKVYASKIYHKLGVSGGRELAALEIRNLRAQLDRRKKRADLSEGFGVHRPGARGKSSTGQKKQEEKGEGNATV